MSIYPPPSEPVVLPEYREPGERERSFLSLGLNDGQTLQHFLLIGKKYIWLVLVCALLGTARGLRGECHDAEGIQLHGEH